MFNFNNIYRPDSPSMDQTPTQIPWGVPGEPDPRIMQTSYDVPQNVPIPPIDASSLMGSIQTPQPVQPQQSPEIDHLNAVLNQYTQNKQNQQSGNNFLTQILANRVSPESVDTTRSVLNSALTNSYSSPEQETATRYAAQLAPYTSTLDAQMKAGTQYMNMSGGATGVLINRLMNENPGMSFQDALFRTQSGFRNGLQLDPNGNVIAMPGAPQAQGQVAFGKKLGEQQAIANTSKQIEQQKKTGENIAENQQQASSTGDIVGLYGKLQQDAQTAPSGLAESAIARVANTLNVPTKGSIAQATFDADLNNLYLATIRSLKGTGRVMEQELNKIGEAAPKSTDSNAVKIAKAKAHMAYYTQRMQEFGIDPSTGQSLGGQPSITDVGGQPVNSPTGNATHTYDPNTGQLVPVQ